jgi:poly(A) polymerase
MNDHKRPEPRILTRPEHCLSRKNIDPDARKVMMRLNRNGFKAYLVGGSVRDLLLEKKPKDFDVSTDARPGQIKKLFRNCRIIGRRFRLAHIYFRNNKIIELSTFRKKPLENPPDDSQERVEGRRGDNTFGEPHEDALRRDLTINGLFYDIESFSVIDYVGGIDDLRNGIVRTIGDPVERFQEDPLRMIRTVRHAAQAGFQIEPDTYAAIRSHARLLKDSNVSRLQDDIQKDLDRGVYASVLRMQMETGILESTFPELDLYLRTGIEDGSLFRPEWIWRSLALLDQDKGPSPQAHRFRLATLFFPLLEKRLLEAFDTFPGPAQSLKETHQHLTECSSPLGVHRRVREDLKVLWSSWQRLLGAVSGGKVPVRFQKKPYFEDVCNWYRFHGSVAGDAEDGFLERLHQAVRAGKATGNRRKRRRRKPAKPS